jgi:hypothetical protein
VLVAKRALVWLMALTLTACSTTTTVEPVGGARTARPADCEIEFVERGSSPSGAHATIARIESHVKRNRFFGGRVPLRDEALAELRRQACALGADKVRIDDIVESSASEMVHVHVWATALKASP